MIDALCSFCKCRKPLGDFYIRKESGRPSSRCKACADRRAKEWALLNPDKRKAIKKKHYEANKDRWRGYKKSSVDELRHSYIRSLWVSKGYPAPPIGVIELHAAHLKINRHIKETK